MKSITRFTGSVFVAAIMTVAFSSKSDAVPAFARQMGVSCTTCHFQHFPLLNAFGRAFKAGGYSMKGSQAMIEDENLSIPATLNATFVTRLRDIKTNGSSGMGTDNSLGNMDLPQEAAIIVAGRGGEHIGFLAEIDAKAGGLTSLRVPVGWVLGDGNLEVVPFSTMTSGAPEGFELLSTGALSDVRAFEDAVRAGSAARYLYLTDGKAVTGIALVYSNPLFFVNITPFIPSVNGGPVTSFANYGRAAVTPQVAGWDLGVGVQYWGGTYQGDTKDLNGTIDLKQDANALIIDAQAMGQAGAMPLGVFLSYGSIPKHTGSNIALTGNGAKDATVTSISAELGVHPKATVGAAFRTGKNNAGKSDNAAELIGTYKLAQNIQVGLTYATLGGDAHNATTAATPGDGVTSSMMINMFAAF